MSDLAKQAEKLAESKKNSRKVTPKSVVQSDRVKRAVEGLKSLAYDYSGEKIAENVSNNVQVEGAENRLYKAIADEFSELLKQARAEERRKTINEIQKVAGQGKEHEKLKQAISDLNIQ